MANAEFSYKDNTLKIYISGEIDHHSAFEIKDIIDCQLLHYSPKTAVMNFERVTFMDSSGIGLVMGRYRNLQKTGASLHISGASQSIYKVMKLAGIEKLAKLEGK